VARKKERQNGGQVQNIKWQVDKEAIQQLESARVTTLGDVSHKHDAR
jgi:hypothetical protein